MHDDPPKQLTDLLARLRIATPEQVRAVRPAARALARDLPLFESVWVDALVQSRLLTPFQGAEINAGRGACLAVGPYVIRSPFGSSLGYAESFLAEHAYTKRAVHLLVARNIPSQRHQSATLQWQAILERFQTLQKSLQLPAPPRTENPTKPSARRKRTKPPILLSGIANLEAAGIDDQTHWAAFAPTTGVTADQWISWHGRLPPATALEVARQMVAVLSKLQSAGISHGDLAASSLILRESGQIQLSRCGVRNIFRPDESDLLDTMPIEAFDYLPPERLSLTSSSTQLTTDVAQQTHAADIYACGCLWSHLATGRPPIAGGNHEAKLQAVRAAKIPDVRRLAPDVPKQLADVIARCTQANPSARPASFRELESLLGPPTTAGKRRLQDLISRSGRRTVEVQWSWRAKSTLQKASTQLIAAAACLLLLAAATWPLWKSRHTAVARSAERSIAARPLTTVAAIGRPTSVVAHPAVDPAIRQVNYQTTETPPPASPKPTPERPVLELSPDSEIAGNTLRFQPGTIVRGKENKRLRIAVPPNGLPIAVDNVRFENVDFLWRHSPEAITAPDRIALIDMRGAHSEFIGCTFQAAPAGSYDLPPAIRLAGSSQHATLAPASQIRLEKCVLSSTACGIDCALVGPAAIEISDTLHLGHGALVRFSQPRRGDSPAAVTLQHVTVRSATTVVEINTGDASDDPGPVTVTATSCVLAPENGTLLTFVGHRIQPSFAGRLRGIEWAGDGSLTPPGTPVAIWRHDDQIETLADDELSIEGLVSSAVEFTADPTNDPATSQLKKWTAPVQSDQPPGIPDTLPTPPAIEPH